MTINGQTVDIELLVQQVMADLSVSPEMPQADVPKPETVSAAKPAESGPAESGPAEKGPVENRPINNRPIENEPIKNTPAEKPVEKIPVEEPKEEPLEAVIRLTDRVISLAVIKKASLLPENRGAKQVRVPAGAVVTPSVRDEMKKRHWELVFDGANQQAAQNGSKENRDCGCSAPEAAGDGYRPFVPYRPNPVTAASAKEWPSIITALHQLPMETFPKPLRERLESAGPQFKSSCVIEAAREINRNMTENSGAKGVLLTANPSVPSAILNRFSTVRALIGIDPARMEEEAAQLGANVLIIDGKRTGLYAVRRMVSRFAEIGSAEVPAVLRKGLETGRDGNGGRK